METLEEISYSFVNNAALYLSNHGAPSDRYIDSKIYGDKGDEVDINLKKFLYNNFCEVPENIIFISMTPINYTLATSEEDENNFKKLFANFFWGLENKVQDEEEIPYQIYLPGDIIYNQDLSLDKATKDTFDFFKKERNSYEKYNPSEAVFIIDESQKRKTRIISSLKKDILQREGDDKRAISVITGYAYSPNSRLGISQSYTIRKFFDLINKEKYRDLWEGQEYLVIFAPFCNPTWFNDTRADFLPNYIIQNFRELIQKKGQKNFYEYKENLEHLYTQPSKPREDFSHQSKISIKSDSEFLKSKKGKFQYKVEGEEQEDHWFLPEENNLKDYEDSEAEKNESYNEEKELFEKRKYNLIPEIYEIEDDEEKAQYFLKMIIREYKARIGGKRKYKKRKYKKRKTKNMKKKSKKRKTKRKIIKSRKNVISDKMYL